MDSGLELLVHWCSGGWFFAYDSHWIHKRLTSRGPLFVVFFLAEAMQHLGGTGCRNDRFLLVLPGK